MFLGQNYTPPDPNEIIAYSMDFVDQLSAGENIISASARLEVISGPDTNPNAALAASTNYNGTMVTQLVGPLVAGTKYRLTESVITDLGQRIELWSELDCQAPT